MSESLTSRRERKKSETRAALLQAARTLFQTKGFDLTSLDEIAEAADVSRGTLFNYFPNKESLLSDIAIEEMQELRRLMLGLSEIASPMGRIHHAMQLFVCGTVHRSGASFLPVTRRVLLENLVHPASIPAPIAQMGSIVQELIEQAQAQGELDAHLDPEHLAQCIVGAYLVAWAWNRWLNMDAGEAAVSGAEIEPLVNALLTAMKVKN